jgi:hypothetical protein
MENHMSKAPDQNVKDMLSGIKSPMKALQSAIANAPHPQVAAYLENAVLGLLITELPKVHMLFTGGGLMLVSEMNTCLDIFNEAVIAAEKSELTAEETGLTPEVIQAGREVSVVLDGVIAKHLDGAEYANREAYIDMIASHAALMAAATSLAVPQIQVDAYLTEEEAHKAAQAEANETNADLN